MESVLTTNKLDWIVLGNSGGNSNRCVFMVIVVVGINIIRKSHCWHRNNKVTWTKESSMSAIGIISNNIPVRATEEFIIGGMP